MSPVEWSPCRPRTIQLPLTAFPCSRLSRPRSTISQSDFHPVIRPFSPLRLGRSYRLAPEPDGSPLFTLLPLVACWRYRTPGAPRTARVVAACDSAFPFERQGRLLRSRSISGLYSRSLHSGLQPPCLRFATAVTGRHARLGSRLLARLCRGRHCRRQTSTRLQGATLIGRVEGWRAGMARRSRSTPRLQPPPRRTQRADFPHCAPPFASRQSLWDLSCWGDFRPVASYSIGVEQP